MSVLEYFQIAKKNWWKLVISVVIFGVIGVFYAESRIPIYRAESKLLFVESKNSLIGEIAGAGGNFLLESIGKKSDPLMTQLELIKTYPVLQSVIDSLNWRDGDQVKVKPDALRKILRIDVVPNTNIIQMSIELEDSVLTQKVLDRLMANYIEMNIYLNKDNAIRMRKFIDQQIMEKQLELIRAEAELVNYKSNMRSVNLTKQVESQVNSLSQIESNLTLVESQIQGVIAESVDLKIRLEDESLRTSSMYTLWKSQFDALESRRRNLEAQKLSLESQLNIKSKNLVQLPKQEMDLANLVRDLTVAQTVFDQLLEMQQQARVREAMESSSIQIVEPAKTQDIAVWPKKKKMVIVFVVIGFGLVYGLLVLLYLFRDSKPTVALVDKMFDLPILGAIPRESKKKILLTSKSASAGVTEKMHILYVNLKLSGLFSQKGNVLLVTSSMPGEGKTTTSVNLSQIAVEHGRKVILLGLDLRRPTISNLIEWDFQYDIADVLLGEKTFEETVAKLDSGLHILPSTKNVPNPINLLSSQRLGQLISDLKKEYDMIVLDIPPFGMVADGMIISQYSDFVLLVASEQDGSTRALSKLYHSVISNQLNCLGFLINKTENNEGGYY
jgi:capsular exopolysaccharide synthesis family protein